MSNETWYKVDNVAKVFLASFSKRDTRSFRVSCTLKEPINKELLVEALRQTVDGRPQYQVHIHHGVFWHYMEHTEQEARVTEESQRPCPSLYGPDSEEPLHYTVTYYRNRINLDMFHALSDGNGGLDFLNILVLNYLRLKYPGELTQIAIENGASANDLEEDSYKQFFENKGDGKKDEGTPKKAYHIRGLKHPYNQLQFFEVHMSAKDVLVHAKEAEATLTSYLGARLMMAVHDDMPALQRKKPITISMPVNLRNFFPSETGRNFFNSVYVSHVFKGDETIESLAKIFDTQLKSSLTPEQISIRMDNYEKIEQLLFVRMVPLFIKNPVVKIASRREVKRVTAVISNLGRLSVPAEMKEYIKSYAAFCSTNTLFITCLSYGDDLTFGVACAYQNTSVLKNFFRGLTNLGIEASIEATEIIN